MLSHTEFKEKIELLQEEISSYADVDEPALITETAQRLKGLNYAPPVNLPLMDFLELTTEKLRAEMDRIANLADEDVPLLAGNEEQGVWETKLQHISVLVFYFRELVQLRRGVPEAWDEVDELYVHD